MVEYLPRSRIGADPKRRWRDGGPAVVRVAAVVVTPTAWNPSDKSAGITLSGSNLVATSNGAALQNVRTVGGRSSGKYYWEVTSTVNFTNTGFGAANGTAPIGSFSNNTVANTVGAAIYNLTSGTIYVNGVNVGSGTAYTLGQASGVALDLDNYRIWFRATPAGNWNGSGAANPATNTGGFAVPFDAVTPAYPLAIFNFSNNSVQTANFGASAFAGAVPSGFASGFG